MNDPMIDVAIIGGGPAGIAAALRLKARGVPRVTIIEREEVTGGVPRHCGHPPFGMREFGRILTGPAYARRLAAAAQAAGVEILLRHGVVALLPGGGLTIAAPDGVKQIEARRVLLATGARETSRAARLVGGTRPLGVLNTGALQAYVTLHGLVPFRRPVVVGTELVSLSALSTCRHHNIRPVAMIEANSRLTASWPFTLYPKLLGVPLYLNATIDRIDGISRVERVVLSNGQSLECDGVLSPASFCRRRASCNPVICTSMTARAARRWTSMAAVRTLPISRRAICSAPSSWRGGASGKGRWRVIISRMICPAACPAPRARWRCWRGRMCAS